VPSAVSPRYSWPSASKLKKEEEEEEVGGVAVMASGDAKC